MMKVWQSQGLSTQISLKCSTDSVLELLIPYLYACLSISILSAKHYQATIFPHSNTKPSEMSRSKNSTSHMDKSPGVFWFQLPSLHAWVPIVFCPLALQFNLQSNVREIRDDLVKIFISPCIPLPTEGHGLSSRNYMLPFQFWRKYSLCHILEIFTMCMLISILISLYVLEPLSQLMKPQGIKN